MNKQEIVVFLPLTFPSRLTPSRWFEPFPSRPGGRNRKILQTRYRQVLTIHKESRKL